MHGLRVSAANSASFSASFFKVATRESLFLALEVARMNVRSDREKRWQVLTWWWRGTSWFFWYLLLLLLLLLNSDLRFEVRVVDEDWIFEKMSEILEWVQGDYLQIRLLRLIATRWLLKALWSQICCLLIDLKEVNLPSGSYIDLGLSLSLVGSILS